MFDEFKQFVRQGKLASLERTMATAGFKKTIEGEFTYVPTGTNDYVKIPDEELSLLFSRIYSDSASWIFPDEFVQRSRHPGDIYLSLEKPKETGNPERPYTQRYVAFVRSRENR